MIDFVFESGGETSGAVHTTLANIESSPVSDTSCINTAYINEVNI